MLFSKKTVAREGIVMVPHSGETVSIDMGGTDVVDAGIARLNDVV